MSEVIIDGADIAFSCPENDSLLRGGLRAGVSLPYECNSGGCGACKVKILEGEYENFYPEAPGLSERDRKKGMVLACQCRPVSDRIKIKTRLNVVDKNMPSPIKLSSILTSKVEIAQDLMEFSFRLDEAVDYLPGQFFMVNIPGVGERAYSNSSIASKKGEVKFIIKRMPGGKGSGYLFSEASVGDHFSIDGPFGHAYLRDEGERDIVLIAGGSGLSPMVSILRSLSVNRKFSGGVHFFYGAKTPADLNNNFVHHVASGINGHFNFIAGMSADEDELAEWQGERGFIHQVVDRCFQDYQGAEFYLCGPPPMTAAAQKHLMIDKNVPFERIHFDRFF